MKLTQKIFKQYPLGMNYRNYLISRINPRESMMLAKDKEGFKRLMASHGIATSRTLNVIKNFSQMRSLESFPAEFVVKPNRGSGGNGILILKKTGDSFVSLGGTAYSKNSLLHHMRRILDGEFSSNREDDWVLFEEKIYPSEKMKFKNSSGLSDIRVYCYDSKPIMAMIRQSVFASHGRANLSQGAVGIGVDIDSGKITHIHSKGEHEPIVAKDLDLSEDYVVPKWKEIKKIAQKSAEISGMKMAGIDIVIDSQENVLVLEVNGRPGLEIQNINEKSLAQLVALG